MWETPAITEVLCMNAEIGAYQEDDRERDDVPILRDEPASTTPEPAPSPR